MEAKKCRNCENDLKYDKDRECYVCLLCNPPRVIKEPDPIGDEIKVLERQLAPAKRKVRDIEKLLDELAAKKANSTVEEVVDDRQTDEVSEMLKQDIEDLPYHALTTIAKSFGINIHAKKKPVLIELIKEAKDAKNRREIQSEKEEGQETNEIGKEQL